VVSRGHRSLAEWSPPRHTQIIASAHFFRLKIPVDRRYKLAPYNGHKVALFGTHQLRYHAMFEKSMNSRFSSPLLLAEEVRASSLYQVPKILSPVSP
jgi:hypothetical protein